MKMQDQVMRKSPIGALDQPAGQAVELKPGGNHVMLLDLKAQLKEGDSVPLTLTIENRDGSRQTLEVKAPVRPLAAAGGMPMRHGH
jgi:copper(I)-binding protein